MAYFQQYNNEEERQNQNNTAGTTGGNTYSTSLSEVSSTLDNTDNKKSDSGSGFVNLNKYLDSNKGEIGKYAQSFVNDDLNRGKQYQSDLNNSLYSYEKALKSDPSYTYRDSTSNYSDSSMLKQYLRDSGSLNQSEKNRIMNVGRGYQGDDEFQKTGNKYGYNNLKKTSDTFSTLSNNIDDKDYLRTKMSNDLSSGGKNLDSFLLGAAEDSKKVISDAKNSFSDLSKLLDTTTSGANATRNSVVKTANKNAAEFNALKDKERQAIEDSLRTQYNKSQAINDRIKEQNKNLTNLINLPSGSSGGGYYNYYKDLSKQALDNLNKELRELNNRYNALSGSTPLEGDSKLDNNLQSYEFVAPNEQQKKEQDFRSKVFNLMLEDRTLTKAIPPDAIASLKRAYVLGEIDRDELGRRIFKYKSDYYHY